MNTSKLARIGLAAGAASFTLLIHGTAHADDVDVLGMKYGAARGVISQAGMQAQVATVLGDRLTQSECVIAGTSRVTVRDSSGQPGRTPVMQLNLNCYKQANEKGAGFSAADNGSAAEAVRVQEAAASRKWKQTTTEGQEYCANRTLEHPEWAPDPDCGQEN